MPSCATDTSVTRLPDAMTLDLSTRGKQGRQSMLRWSLHREFVQSHGHVTRCLSLSYAITLFCWATHTGIGRQTAVHSKLPAESINGAPSAWILYRVGISSLGSLVGAPAGWLPVVQRGWGRRRSGARSSSVCRRKACLPSWWLPTAVPSGRCVCESPVIEPMLKMHCTTRSSALGESSHSSGRMLSFRYGSSVSRRTRRWPLFVGGPKLRKSGPCRGICRLQPIRDRYRRRCRGDGVTVH